MDEKISIDDFKKVEIRVGEVMSAEKVEGADKLLRLQVNFGPSAALAMAGKDEIRQVISGIAEYFPDPQVLVGKRYPFATNLAPRTIRGFESQAMILAVGGPSTELGVNDSPFVLLEASGAKPGARVR